MIIYTNESNPNTVRLLICANFSNKSVEIRTTSLPSTALDEPNRLPTLVLDCGQQIFMCDEAARVIYGRDEKLASGSKFTLFTLYGSNILAPRLLRAFTSNSKVDDKLKGLLDESLKLIDTYCSNKDSTTSTDISLWSLLYPMYLDKKLQEEYLKKYPKTMDWLEILSSVPQFKDALSKHPLTAGTPSYQALLVGMQLSLPAAGPSAANDPKPLEHSVHQFEAASEQEVKSAEAAWFKGMKHLPSPKEFSKPILPVENERNILITSALPYVNNVPHLGNIVGCVLSADVFARFCRLCNHNTLYICGTDEYGTATETKALEEGLTPQQICDKYYAIHSAIYRWFGIDFDFFGRTSTPEQTEIVQQMFVTLNGNGFMQVQSVEQLLCEKCDRYLADRFVEGGCPHPGCGFDDARGDQCDGCGKLVNATELKDPKCKICRATPVVRQSSQFFLDLPKIEPLLRHWMKISSPNWSNNACVIGNAWLKEGLKPRCITRDLKWGIPVPLVGYEKKVFYVWFDAPLGYMSITKRYTAEWKKWWQPEAKVNVDLYQFMGKDNVPFHSVMFPATLLGANQGYTIVSHIMATEYLNYEDGKFSKSRGVGVFGTDAQSTGIPSDVWRFYLMYMRPEGQDSSFSWFDFGLKINSELLNNLGNFVNRALMFTEKNFDCTLPEMSPTVEDFNVLALCTRELKEYISSLQKSKLKDGIRCILAISKYGNQYMQTMKPWVLLKGNDQEKSRAGTVIGICVNLSCLLATLLYPYMPETCALMQKQLNAPKSTAVLVPENPVIVTLLPAGHKIGKPAPLFAKIEQSQIDKLKAQFAGKQSQEVDKFKKSKPATAAGIKSTENSQEIKYLEEEVEKQALLVRKLKEGGSDPSEWKPQVTTLLDLKNKLAAVSGIPISKGKSKK